MTQSILRSEMSYGDCYIAITQFAKHIRRFGETSDAGMFIGIGGDDEEPMKAGELNIQLCVAGRFGDADAFFEALRVLMGAKLPRETSKMSEARLRELGAKV